MAQRKTLTEWQVSILRWIAEGSPDGVMDGISHRVSAAALRNRGLVKTSGRGPNWSARITAAGREYLARVDGPSPPVPRQANLSVAEQLVDDVIAAGGSLRVPRRGWQGWGGIDYERRAQLAKRYRKVPPGSRLLIKRLGAEVEISLVDAPELRAKSELVAVVVPRRVAHLHRTARSFRDDRRGHRVSRELLPRATRIVHAIAVEAERRRWSTQAPAQPGNAAGSGLKPGSGSEALHVVAHGFEFSLRLHEEGVHVRGPWEEQVRSSGAALRDSFSFRDRELPSGPYDADASGRLELELRCAQTHLYRGRQSRWGDRQSSRLEDLLPHLFRELEERILEAEYEAEARRVAARRAAHVAQRQLEERAREWQRLMDRAKEAFADAHRATQLQAQADAWHRTNRLRSYCDAVEALHGDHPDTAEWLEWARAYAARIDPLRQPPAIPEVPEPTSDALQAYLPHGWSAQGPDHTSPTPPAAPARRRR